MIQTIQHRSSLICADIFKDPVKVSLDHRLVISDDRRDQFENLLNIRQPFYYALYFCFCQIQLCDHIMHTCTTGNLVCIFPRWGTISSKSTNLKTTLVTVLVACWPQLRSNASSEPGPYRYNISPSSSARWQMVESDTPSWLKSGIFKMLHNFGDFYVLCSNDLGS